MKISKNCVELIKQFEGFRSDAYRDPVGVWTIGYGTTDADFDITNTKIKEGMTISEGLASEWLEISVNTKYLPRVLKYDHIYHFTQNELDALVSFAYNIGSIDQLTSNGTRTREEISNKITEYVKAGGKVLPGLVIRRRKEKDLFDKKDPASLGVMYMADEVISGMWGNGKERYERISEAIQNEVNRRYR